MSVSTSSTALALTKSNDIIGVDSANLLASNNPIVQSLDVRLYLSYLQWNKSDLTYSYNSSIPQDYISQNVSITGWQPVTTDAQTVINQIMSNTNALIAASLTPTANNGDIRINSIDVTGMGENGHAYYPGSGEVSGDIFLNANMSTNTSDHNASLIVGDYGYSTVIHELGHALGLKHPFEDGYALTQADDHSAHSVMSYTQYKPWQLVFSFEKIGNSSSVSMATQSISPSSFMVYDMAALHAIYGAELTTATGNNIYQFSDDPFYQTIWDAGGEDTLDFSLTSSKNIIRLSSGSYSDISFDSIEAQIATQQLKYQTELNTSYFNDFVADAFNENTSKVYTGENALGIAYGVIIENAIGGSANDIFYDNHVDNALYGGEGDDLFYLGAGGFDTIDGGNGTDTLQVNLNKLDVRFAQDELGSKLVIADNFAVKLSNIEQIQFADRLLNMADYMPTNTTPIGSVTITGIASYGQTLIASNSLSDIDGVGAISYQWKANGSNIIGATNSTYTLTQAEVGKTISVVASYTDGHGTAESVSSDATTVVVYDNNAPTATITLSDTTLRFGETAQVDIQFTEAVTNFSNSDLTVEGGTLSTLTSSDNIIWTGTFTPTADSTSIGRIVLDSNGYNDMAGNIGSTSVSNDIIINTVMPASPQEYAQQVSLIELYVAWFDRVPDAAGVDYWVNQLKSGLSLEKISNVFYEVAVNQFSNETGYYSSMNDSEFITKLYEGIMGRVGDLAPNESEIAYWSGRLADFGGDKGILVKEMLIAIKEYDATNQPDIKAIQDKFKNKMYVAEQLSLVDKYNGSIEESKSILKGVTDNYTSIIATLDSYRSNNALDIEQVPKAALASLSSLPVQLAGEYSDQISTTFEVNNPLSEYVYDQTHWSWNGESWNGNDYWNQTGAQITDGVWFGTGVEVTGGMSIVNDVLVL